MCSLVEDRQNLQHLTSNSQAGIAWLGGPQSQQYIQIKSKVGGAKE